ncbi:Phosphatidylinositol phosphatase PTPRQ, partial [Trichinella spiralis]
YRLNTTARRRAQVAKDKKSETLHIGDPSRRCVIRDLGVVDGYFCFLFFNLTTASRLCYNNEYEYRRNWLTCHLTDQNYRCASSVQTIFSVYEQISSFLLFRSHTASTVVRWSTSVVVNSNFHCLVSVYSAPLKADAIFSLNYNRRLSILCTSNYPALQCASTTPFAITLANFAISFFYFFYFSIQLHLYAAIVYTEKETTIIQSAICSTGLKLLKLINRAFTEMEWKQSCLAFNVVEMSIQLSRELNAIFSGPKAGNGQNLVRVRRQTVPAGGSILTVEWEGIHSGVPDDSAISGFTIEYRPENDDNWIQHDGVIPYQGPHYQYRVRIKDLPSGIVYFVRIKVLARNGEVLVQTPEIKAQSETVKIVCNDDITAPRNIRILSSGKHSLTFVWDPPECGNVAKYEYLLKGVDEWALFDVHQDAVTDSETTIRNLLPGTTYSIKVRAVDLTNRLGPWSEHSIHAATEGRAPAVSSEIHVIYKSDKDIRIEWKPYSEYRIQHYEVLISERTGDHEAVHVFRDQIASNETTYLFSDLKPFTEYNIGVIAFAQHEPRLVYRLQIRTSKNEAKLWPILPSVHSKTLGKFSVQWSQPTEFQDRTLKGFFVEYRLRNESTWKPYGDFIPYLPGQKDYNTEITGFSEKIIYAIRVYLVDDSGEVVAVTDEFNVGSESATSCNGAAGVPLDLRTYIVTQNSITFTWSRPTCDENFGPIEGFEYKFWNRKSRNGEPKFPSFVKKDKVSIDRLQPAESYAFKVRSKSRSGHSPWSEVINAQTKPAAEREMGNIFNLRIILAPPRSFLAWTPLPEHRDQVRRFKLSYKLSTSDQWQKFEDFPEEFECPPGIADELNYCYDLSSLQFGVQYTADIAYQLKNGEWSKKGNPLFFILVEAGVPKIPEAPARLTVRFITENTAEISWLPPLSDVKIDEYEISLTVISSSHAGVSPGNTFSLRTPGTTYSQTVDKFHPDTVYNVSVTANSRGNHGRAVWEIVGRTPPTFEVKEPKVRQKGDTFIVLWEVAGREQNLCCYQIDARQEHEHEWHTVSGPVNHQAGQRMYSQELSGLRSTARYHIRVRAISFDNYATVATSPAVAVATQCQAPSAPPEDVRVKAVDQNTMLLSWNHPDRSTWGCPDIYYIVEGVVDRQPPQQYQVRADPRGFRVEHRVQSQGGKEWRFRIQTANSYALSSMPQVRIQGDRNQITWYSQGAGSGKVYGYVVECSSGERGWKQEGAIVPFRGDNMLYRVEVPLNRCTLIRVSVIDKNQKVIYSSPEVSAETHCLPPKEAPSEIVLTAPDPKHVRISWQAPNRATWQCGEVEYEIQVLEPAHIRPIRLNSRANTHVLDSEPNQRWVVQMRTVSRGGSSAWSSSSHVRTPVANELITTPIVFDQQNIPTLTWYSVDGVQELVAFYRVELQRDGDQRWTPISHGDVSILIVVKYAGSQRPYSVQLTDLRSNEKAQVRVLVIDHNNDIQYTSPAIRVQKNDDCKPPRSYPGDINVEPIGSFKIRVSWKPLTRAEWNCEKQGWYILKYSNSAEQGFRNYSAHNSFAELESSAHTSWEFQLQAANEAGKSPWSSVVTGKTQSSIPGPVLNVRSSSVGANSVQLTWMPPAQPNGVISGYKISYQLLSKGQCEDSPGRVVTLSSKEPRITLQGLHPNSRYKATVTAETTVPGEATSYEFVTDESIPSGAPRAFQATDIRSDRVHLSWQAPACLMTNGDITSFEYELTGADNWAAGQYHRQKTNSNSAEVTGLTGMTKYKGRVRAFTNKGAGPWSEYVIITTRSADSPGAVPMVRIVDAQSDSVMVMWLAPYPPLGRINRYRVQCAPSGSGRWKIEEFPLERAVCPEEVVRRLKTQSTINGQAYCARIGNLSPEQAYDFQVSALGEFGSWGPWSNLQTAKTGSGPVQILNLEKTDVTQNSIGIQWDVASHDQGRIRGFKIVAVPVSRERMVQEYTVDNIITQYRIDGLSGNTMYNITVQARTDSGYHPGPSILVKTGESAGSFVIDLELARVVVPPVLSAQGSDSIRVRWIAPIESHSITGYKVEYKTAALPDWRQHGDIIPQSQRKTTFETLIDKLTPNTDVTVRIVTVGSGQRFGIPSKEVSERTFCAAPSSPPQNIRLDSLSPSQIRLNWAAPPKSTWQCDVINYEIAYSTGVDPVEKVLHASGQSSEYLLPSAPHTQWQIKMRTTNKVGSSAWSEERDITTKQGAPGRVRGFTLTSISPNEVKACWAMPSEKHGVIVGYDVSYRLKHRLACPDEEPKDVSRAWITVYNVKGLDYTLTGLLPYAEYEVKVRARTTELGPEELKIVQTQPQPPSAPPLDLKTTFQLERSLSFVWEPVECSQRHGYIMNYEYELIGMDDWAKLDVRIANTTDQKVCRQYENNFCNIAAKIVDGDYGVWSSHAIANTLVALPDAPRAITLIGKTDSSLSISWLPPEDPHGRITGFKITIDAVSQNAAVGTISKTYPVHASKREFTIADLEPDTPYNVTVQAATSRGYGPGTSTVYSTDSSVVPALNVPPTMVEQKPNCITVSWTPSSYAKEKLLGYIIEYRKYNEHLWREYDGVIKHDSNKPIYTEQVCGLQPDTSYLFRVKVIDMKSKVSEPSPHLESRSGCLAPTSPPSNVRISALSATEVRIMWQPTPPDAWLCSSVNYRLMLSNGTHRKHDVELVSSATDHTLQSEPHTKWTAQIRTENIAGSSHWSEEVSVVTPESAPGVVGNVVGEPQGYDRIKVMWTPPEQPNGVITGYVVSYKLKSIGSCPSPVSRQEEKQLIGEKTILKGLEPASTYEITVRAKTTHEGENSKPIYVTTEEIAPTAAPQSVNVGNVLKTAAALTWEEPPCTKQHGEIIEYEYTVKSEDPWVTDVQTATTNSERVQVVDLVPFTQYSFIVRAVNSKGKGPYSEPVKFLTRSEAPLPPMDLRTDGEFPSAISISFLPPSPPYGILDEYRIRYTPIDRISWHEVRKAPNELSCARADQGEQRLCYRIVGLDPEKEHVVQASAHTESGGWGDWSKSLYAQTKEAVIEAPLRVSNQGPTSLTLMWEGVGGNAARHVKGYVLEYNVGGRSDWIQHNDVILNKAADAGQIYTETVDKLVPDTTYYFRLHVVDRNNRKGLSGPELQTHTLCGKPSMAPQNVHVEADRTNNVHLKWEAVPKQAWHCSNVSYVIKFHNSTHSGYVDLSSTKTEYKTHSEPGVRWSFQVRTQAYDRSGSRSQFSDWSPEKVFTMPGIPELIFIDLKKRGPDSLQLNWHVAADIEDWPHGVDVTYVMRQKGNCPPLTESQLTPITEYNVYEKYMLLQNLEPYSLYEVTVSPRNPLRSDSKEVKLPKASKTVRTGEKAPESAPREIRAKDITENSALLTWDPPSCELQNGEITQYEYLLTGIDEWVQSVHRQATTARTRASLHDLLPGTKYKFQARAYTSHGHGPWSTPFEIETLGSELGMPREVHPVSISDRHVTLTWLPPYPSRGAINSYRMRYRTRDGKLTKDILLNRNDLSCQNIKNPLTTEDSVCYTVEPLNPMTSYQFEVTAVSQDGSQGVWSPSVYVTTKDRLVDSQSGDLTLLYADADSIKVRWDPPNDRRNEITNYLITVAPFDPAFGTTGIGSQYTVPRPGNRIKFDGLQPETIYNVTVQAATKRGYGETLWGVYSTLPPPGTNHILKLRNRTPTSLHVMWIPFWGTRLAGYNLKAKPLWSGHRLIDADEIVQRVEPNKVDHVIRGLTPSTVYNVSLSPINRTGETWGVYATLPPGAFLVNNLKICAHSPYAFSLTWDAVEDPVATHYQVRYLVDGVQEWYEHPQKSQFDLRCPGDPCENMCYLIYNLDGKPHQYTIQVRAFVEGTWNQWKTAVIPTTFMSSASSAAKLCCIVPPNYYVENIGDMDTLMPVIIKPVPNDTYVQRYFVVVDERDPSGPINETMLTDKLTARKMGIPYYVAGSFDRNTLTAEREFVIGNGEVHGGYLNYPLIKGKKYNWAFVTMWMVDGKPVVGMYRVVVETFYENIFFHKFTESFSNYLPICLDKSSVSSRYIGGWPWWWLLLFLLCLLLLILLICCLFWCCASRLRRRKRIITSLEARQPLLGDEKLKSDMAQNLKALESRIDNIRTQLESKVRSPQGKGEFEDGYVRGFRDANKLSGPSMARQRMDEDYGSMKMDFHAGYVQGLRDAGMQGMTQSMHNLANRAGQGGYSSGYMQGFRDGNSGIFGDRITTTLLRRLEDQYPNQDEFRQGYVEGFKDGVSSRVSESRQKDDDSTRVVSETLNKLTEKLSTLERQTREKGDEIHSTKIYHVYNQLPEGVGMTSSGQYLAQELDEFTRNDSFKRSTLRRHYTPGDYLKYASDTEGATIYPTGSQHPYRRTLSASSLRRDASTPLSGRRTLSGDRERSRHTSIQQYNDTFSRRYQYRSKSDLSPYGYAVPRRYPSQTILDGVRPGPTAPGSRREAVETLQKELSSAYKSGISDRKKMAGADLGRSRLDSERGQGYASDSAFMDSLRRKQIYTPLSSSRRADDAYDSYRSRTSQSRTETERLIRTEITSPTGRQSRPTTRPVRISTKTSGSTTGVSSPEARQGLTSPGSMTSPGSSDVQKQPSTSYRKPKVLRSSLAQAYDLVGLSDESSGSEEHAQVSWTDELMKIVKEPMPETLDRMKKYSTSLSQLPPSPVVYPSSSSKEPGSSRVQGGPVKETITESYSTSYKEEYTTKP